MALPPRGEFNPYAPPTAPLGDGPPRPERIAVFRSTAPFAQAITILLIVYGIVVVSNIIHEAVALTAMERVVAGVATEAVELEAINKRAAVLQGLPGLVYLPVAVLFCLLMVRSNRNVHAFNLIGPEFTPGWAAGVLFVPIWNFYKPYQAMREIWCGSDPNPDAVVIMASLKGTSLLKWWWAMFLASMVHLGGFSPGPGPATFITRTKAKIMELLVDLAAAALAFVVVRAVAARQDARQRVRPAPTA